MPQRKLMSEFREKEKEIWEPEQVVKEDKNPPWKSCSSYTAQEVELLLHILSHLWEGKNICHSFAHRVNCGLTISQASFITYTGTLTSTDEFCFVVLLIWFYCFFLPKLTIIWHVWNVIWVSFVRCAVV